jgi:hypothetical protein
MSWEQPPKKFVAWFEPNRIDKESGASVGGHPDAYRIWARQDQGQWRRKRYGMTAEVAWNTKRLREQFERRPANEPPFISVALPLAKQQPPDVSHLCKPMPRPTAKETQAEARRLGLPHRMIEPLDEVAEIPF